MCLAGTINCQLGQYMWLAGTIHVASWDNKVSCGTIKRPAGIIKMDLENIKYLCRDEKGK